MGAQVQYPRWQVLLLDVHSAVSLSFGPKKIRQLPPRSTGGNALKATHPDSQLCDIVTPWRRPAALLKSCLAVAGPAELPFLPRVRSPSKGASRY